MDRHALAMMSQTAASFRKLAALRGVPCTIDVSKDGKYLVNGTIDCGTSVHGLYDWLNKQPNVLP